MRKVILLLITFIIQLVYSIVGNAVTVLPEQGVRFRQVDFLFSGITELNSDWGQVSVNPTDLTNSTDIDGGYLNVYTDVGWVVQNLPLNLGNNNSSVPIAKYFSLGLTSLQEINQLSAYVEFTVEPKQVFTDGTRNNFNIEHIQWNAEGVGDSLITEIAKAPVSNLPTNNAEDDFVFVQPHDVNIEAANNQCFPMAIANSLQYLENSFGLEVPHEHEIGLRGDNSLVGQLDEKADRCVTGRKNGCGVWFAPMLEGKFSYLSENGLADKLVHKHQGRGYGKTLDDGDFKANGITSKDKGSKVTWEWICNELKDDEDVELVLGGHVVRVYGCSSISGVHKLAYLHDRLQTNDNDDPNDKKGTEWVWGDVDDFDGDGILNLDSSDIEISFALSESLGITLNFFAIQSYNNLNLITWKTATETENAGFRVWRGIKIRISNYKPILLGEEGYPELVNSEPSEGCSIKIQGQLKVGNSNQSPKLISAIGNSVESTCYSFTDTSNLGDGTYYYLLEDIGDNGDSTFHCDQIDAVTVGQGPAIDLESAINYCKKVTGSNN